MKPLFALILALSFFTVNFAQTQDSRLDMRLGLGTSLLGTGDITTTMIENELNFTCNKYFSVGGSLALAKGGRDKYNTASFLQGNFNIYLSPFRNNRKNDFRIGGGMSYYNVSDSFISRIDYQNGKIVNIDVLVDNRKSYGFNIVIEDTYAISNRLFIGAKAFVQSYINGDINSGIMLRLGVKL